MPLVCTRFRVVGSREATPYEISCSLPSNILYGSTEAFFASIASLGISVCAKLIFGKFMAVSEGCGDLVAVDVSTCRASKSDLRVYHEALWVPADFQSISSQIIILATEYGQWFVPNRRETNQIRDN